MKNRNEYDRAYYALNSERKRRKSLERYKKVKEYKESNPCVDCEQFYIAIVMDFDHREGTEKVRSIAHMGTYSDERFWREISKCDLVCSNCHRLRTWNRKQRAIDV